MYYAQNKTLFISILNCSRFISGENVHARKFVDLLLLVNNENLNYVIDEWASHGKFWADWKWKIGLIYYFVTFESNLKAENLKTNPGFFLKIQRKFIDRVLAWETFMENVWNFLEVEKILVFFFGWNLPLFPLSLLGVIMNVSMKIEDSDFCYERWLWRKTNVTQDNCDVRWLWLNTSVT